MAKKTTTGNANYKMLQIKKISWVETDRPDPFTAVLSCSLHLLGGFYASLAGLASWGDAGPQRFGIHGPGGLFQSNCAPSLTDAQRVVLVYAVATRLSKMREEDKPN